MKNRELKKKYTEVWGDTVVLKELMLASVIGIVITMGMFFLGQYIFNQIDGLDDGLAEGYALLVGVSGVLLSGVISAKLFKPKRVVEERIEFNDIEDILASAGLTVEEEAEALANAEPRLIEEMEDLELYALLALIPEDSDNYKPEYLELVKGED